MNAMRLPGRVAGLLLLAAAIACSRKPASIQVSPGKVMLYGLDRSQRLTARVLDDKGQPVEGMPPAFSSANTGVATVDGGGRVVSTGEGKTTIAVKAGTVSAEVPIEVVDAATIEVVPARATLLGPSGTSFALVALIKSSRNQSVSLPLTWKSSDENVLQVSPEGAVTSLADGRATVTATVGELQGAADIVVLVRDIARMELRPATALVRVGDSQRFQVAVYAPDGSRLADVMAGFRSSNPEVATIDGAGVALGVAPGTTTIRAELAGQAAEATLIVN